MRVLLLMPNQVSLNAFFGELCMEMESRGFLVHCACSLDGMWAAGRSAPVKQAHLHEISFGRGMNPLQHLRSGRDLRKLVRSIRPDIIHAHFSAVIFTAALARTRSWPVTLATFHGVDYLAASGLKRLLLRTAEAWAASRMDQAWVLNQKDWTELQAVAKKAEVRLQQAFGVGCDLARFDRRGISPQAQETLRRQLGIYPGQAVFAFIGRFVHFKGFPTAVRTFLTLARRDKNTRFLLVGARDPLHPSGLTGEEERALQNCSQIHDVGWQTDVEKFLAITQAVVFPSQREGLPVSIMEALAMGVPVITSDHPANCALVRDGVDGIVVNRPAVDEYLAAMTRLIADKKLYDTLAANALAGRERFDRKHYVAEQVRIYEQLYSTASGRALPAYSVGRETGG